MSDRSGDRTDGTVDRAATSGDDATMSRRSYLTAAGAASTALGAGCLGGGGAGAGGSTTINIITWEEFEEMESNIEDTLDIDIEITPSTSSTEDRKSVV